MGTPTSKTPGRLARTGQATAKVTRAAALWFSMAVLAFIAVNSLLFTSVISPSYDEIIEYKVDFIPAPLLFCLAVLGLAMVLLGRGLWRRIPQKGAEAALYLYALAFGAVWVLSVRSYPVDDALSVFTHAQEFMRGDYSALEYNRYLGAYPFQLGILLYMEVVMRVFGADNYLALQLLNVLWAAGCFFSLVRITSALFRDGRATLLVTLLLFFCLPPLFYTTFIYGVLPGLLCALLSVWFTLLYFEKRKLGFLAAAIGCISLAVLAKNNYLIFAAGLVLVLVVDCLKGGGFKQLIAAILMLVCVSCVQLPVIRYYEARSGMEISAGMPKVLWVAMGLRPSERAPGWYTGVSVGLYEQAGYDAEAAAEAGWRVIGVSLEEFAEDPAYAVRFFYEKTVSQWNEPSFASLWVSHFQAPHTRALGPVAQSLYEGPLNAFVLGEMNCFHLLVFAFSLALLWARRKKLSLPQLLPAIILAGGFVFHMAWEAKSQYVFAYFMLMLPYSAAGLQDVAQWCTGWLERKRTQKRPAE